MGFDGCGFPGGGGDLVWMMRGEGRRGVCGGGGGGGMYRVREGSGDGGCGLRGRGGLRDAVL